VGRYGHRDGRYRAPSKGCLITPLSHSRGASNEVPREHGPLRTAHRRTRDRVVDAVVVVAYVLLAVGMGALSLDPRNTTPLVSMVALAAGGVAVLTVRHRYPRWAFAAALALAVLSVAGGSGAEALLAVIALYAACMRLDGLAAWASFAIALVCGALGAVVLAVRGNIGPPILGLEPPRAPRDTLLDVTNTFVVIAAVLLITALMAMNAGHRRRRMVELLDRAERLARERDQQAETARAFERERIAREMHDVIAHSLSVMIAMSDGAHAVVDHRPDEAKQAIARVAETGRKNLAEVRRLLGSVRGDRANSLEEHSPQPDAGQLTALVAQSVSAGLPMTLTVTGEPLPDPALGLTVYRIVQESLTNVLRHGRDVTCTVVEVSWQVDEVTIAVHNGGAPAAVSSNPGRGLLGMQERVALFNGDIEAGPDVDGGWRVFARLRWENR
jgi:signal transduction histidine kinase